MYLNSAKKLKLKKTLIIGGTGHIGSFLANFLLNKRKVYITTRKITTTKIKNFKILKIKKKINFLQLNVININKIKQILKKVNPHEIYYLAGQSSIVKSFKKKKVTHIINYLGCKNILNILKKTNYKGKFLNIASSEMFGNKKKAISVKSKLNPVSPYGLSKKKSFLITKYFRKQFNLKTYNVIMFNCDSILRPKNFLLPKIALSSILAKKKIKKQFEFGNINLIRDWGDAEDYVKAMHKIIQKKPDDIIIASGNSYKISDLIKFAFKYLKLDWKKFILFSNKKFLRPREIYKNRADLSYTKKKIKWTPKTDAKTLLKKLINYYLKKKIENTHYSN